MFPQDRYPVPEIIRVLSEQEPIFEDDGWAFEFEVYRHNESLDDFSVIWGDGTEATKKLPSLLRQALVDLNFLDNLVQQSCEEDHASSQYDMKNFMLHLAFMTQPSSTSVALEYYGTAVNTQWEAIFERDGDCWKKTNF